MEKNDQKNALSRLKKFLRGKINEILKSKLVCFAIIRVIVSITIIFSSQGMYFIF
jgi:hypothetical protein